MWGRWSRETDLGWFLAWRARRLCGAADVSKVEPPNWWPGHTLNPVRVLIRGTGLTGATVKAMGLKTSHVSVNAGGDLSCW